MGCEKFPEYIIYPAVVRVGEGSLMMILSIDLTASYATPHHATPCPARSQGQGQGQIVTRRTNNEPVSGSASGEASGVRRPLPWRRGDRDNNARGACGGSGGRGVLQISRQQLNN